MHQGGGRSRTNPRAVFTAIVFMIADAFLALGAAITCYKKHTKRETL